MSQQTNEVYSWSVALFIRGIRNLVGILAKADRQSRHRGYPGELLLQSRFYPDMYELAKQLERISDIALSGLALLIDEDPASYRPERANLDGYIQMLRKTLNRLEHSSAEQIRLSSGQVVVIESKSGSRQYADIQQYLQINVLPNFYFHLTTAYNLLRHNGVDIGKQDYLGPQPEPLSYNGLGADI
jgi:uncharacterized protein